GRQPFRGDTSADTLSAILHADPPALTPAGVPPELEHIVRRCLEKSAPNRFQSADDLAAALQTVTLTPAAVAPTVSGVSRMRLRKPLGLVAIAVAVGAGAPGGARGRHRAQVGSR